MFQAHIDAIEIIANRNPDYRAIAIALAKQDPNTFVALHNTTDIVNTPKWIKDAVSHLRTDHLVNAIKECRHATGLGLRNAKTIIDHAAHRLNLRDAPSLSLDDTETRALVEQIVNYGKMVL